MDSAIWVTKAIFDCLSLTSKKVCVMKCCTSLKTLAEVLRSTCEILGWQRSDNVLNSSEAKFVSEVFCATLRWTTHIAKNDELLPF
jgi:hypothetical protein